LSQPQKVSQFIVTGEVLERLNVPRSTLQKMANRIPHLHVQQAGTHIFPAAYIDAFAAYLRQTGYRPVVSSATSFWRSEVAQSIYKLILRQLEAGLDRETLTGKELADLLGISYQTVMHWGNRGVITAQRRRLRAQKRETVIFPCESIRKALVWTTPPAPPTLPPVFFSAAEVNEEVQRRGRDAWESTGMFGHLLTPGRGPLFPAAYVRALLDNTTGPVSRTLVLLFNATDPARETMLEAKKEFERRLVERQRLSPHPDSLITTAEVAWLFGMGSQIVHRWCEGGHLPYVTRSGSKLIRPAALLPRVRWVLPTRK
jgi:predicted DNA-binding transcriptional regulator AlpA